MLDLLEKDFLNVLPDKLLDLTVADFFSKYNGDFNSAFSGVFI